ncbi:MAG: methyl-accepting chemotaxis protein [Gallionella sp.]|nr:methyl-accepting chemotaxis protein [Gallionella sp.]MCK9353634.1 methyl-accepting chemotaxis protein [Gallionella sp.]
MFKNLKIGRRLLVGFALPLALFVAFGGWLQMSMGNISGHVRHVKVESVPFALAAKNMEKEVVQVQQWLTDISATRGLDGLDDGFKEAEASRDSFYRDLSEFQKMYSSEGDQDGLNKVQRIKADFDVYYQTGVKMAQAYIAGGSAEGNKTMGQFDQASLALQSELAPFIKSQVDEMEAAIDESDDETSHARKTALYTLLAVVAIAFLVARTITLSIVRPLTRLQATISEVERNSDFTLLAPVEGRDELAQTAQAFNHLVGRVRDIIRQTRASVDEIATISQELAHTTEQAKNVTHQQSDISATVAASTEELSVAISEIASHTGESETLSEQGRRETREALDITHEGMSGMGATAQAIKDSAANVARLSESSGRISGIVVVIKEIADQTNLLALNAAIEAARAGEQGRGFAVVADEVRKLAERTGGSTEEIGRLIDAIQMEIEHVVEAMSGADEQAARSVETAKHAEEALEKIGHNGDQINNRVKEIANSIKESDIAIHDIAIQMERIAHMTEETSAAAEATDVTADRLDALAADLHRSVEKYKV